MIVASDGVSLDMENLAQTLHYNAQNNVDYIEVTQNGITYRQTFTLNGAGKITDISRWIKQ